MGVTDISGIENEVIKNSVLAKVCLLIVSLKAVGANRLMFDVRLLVCTFVAIYLFITQKRGAPKNSPLN
jgi:hypothetical protein